jgi:hypothetical protein
MDAINDAHREEIPFLLGLREGRSDGDPLFPVDLHQHPSRGYRSGRSEGRDNDQQLTDAPSLHVPFTYRFLGLRLRLAFTKRRFRRVEASYQAHISSRQRRSITNAEARVVLAGLDGELDSSFKTLRLEIDRIERAQEAMRVRALPKVEQLLLLHESYKVFLHGFLTPVTRKEREPQQERESYRRSSCVLPILNVGMETTTALKRLIAEYAGVPSGKMVPDLQSLVVLLRKETLAGGSAVFRERQNRGAPSPLTGEG